MSVLSSVGCPRLPRPFYDGVSGCHLFPASFGGDFGRFVIRTEMVTVNDREGVGERQEGWRGTERDIER